MSQLVVTIDGQPYELEISSSGHTDSPFIVRVNNQTIPVLVPNLDGPVEEMDWLIVDGRPYEIVFDPDLHWIKTCDGVHRVRVRDLASPVTRPASGDGRVKAPIPGLVTRVVVEMGQAVAVGQPLLVLEAMKMENEIRAPRSGVISQLHVSAGQSVVHKELLCEIT